MLTAKNSEYDRAYGLDLGADDYISKPFGMMELTARVRAVLRRARPAAQETEYRVGCLWVCPARHQVTVNAEKVALTYKEFLLLQQLLEAGGAVMTRSVLMDRVWGLAAERGGWMGITPHGNYDFSAEAYYKNIRNVYDYRDGKAFYSEIEIERLILGGKGRAYGVELCAHKNNGSLMGWISYTLSWSENKIEGVNGGRWYAASNDRRHDMAIVGMYHLSPSWELAATWRYNTGQALTAPSAKYDIDGTTFYYYNERNGYRAPAYHRLDLSATYTKKLRKATRIWSFGIYNAYCHYNPFTIRFKNDDKSPTGTIVEQTSLFGIVPSVSFTMKY